MPYTLLLADDSLTIRRVIELTFAEEDLTVTTVGDGRRAIACIASLHPDIVLADAGMPSPGGYEIAAFVKGTPELAHIPVILLTGAFQPIDEARARTAGCDAVLAKPFELTLLVSRVKELLRAAAEPRPARASGAVRREIEGRDGTNAPAASNRDGATDAADSLRPDRGPVSPGDAPDMAGSSTDRPAPQPDPSLDDHFDSIDAVFAQKIATTGTALPLAAGTPLPALPAWDANWSSETDGNRLSLDDYFDLVDAASRNEAPAGESRGEGASVAEPSAAEPALAETGGDIKAENEEGQAATAGAAGATEEAGIAEPLDAVTRTFLALLESAVVPPSPDGVERAVRRLIG